MLDKDDRVACLVNDGQELVCGKWPADLEIVLCTADAREDTRVVAADIEKEEPLEIRIAVERCKDLFFRGYHCGKTTRVQGDPF